MAEKIAAEDNQQSQKILSPGIIYLSRMPPFMRPRKIRNIFSQFGEVGRLFLQPEDVIKRKKRKKHGGSGKKLFTEGWVEFKDKRVAKLVAVSLNNTVIGGKKKTYYHDDIWNIKYLPKFQWTHLSERIAYEKAVREQRKRTEISQAKREASIYLQSVEKGKEITAIEEKNLKKGKKLAKKRLQSFKQNQAIENKKKRARKESSSETESRGSISLSNDLLKKIFSAR